VRINRSRIQQLGDDDDEKHYGQPGIMEYLNKKHKKKDDIFFTKVLTHLGADAHYVSDLKDDSGNKMWKSHERLSVYQFTCRSRNQGGGGFGFIVDVDATKFTYQVRTFEPDENCFVVHCTKRVWDFRLVLSVSQNLEEVYGRFANDLVRSLKVEYVCVQAFAFEVLLTIRLDRGMIDYQY
jgi:hypothetical protein